MSPKSELLVARNLRDRRVQQLEALKHFNLLHKLVFIDLQIQIETNMIRLCNEIISVCYSMLE